MHLERLTGCICFLPEDTIIQKIAGFLKKVGDQWEEEVRGKLSAQMPRGLLPSPPPPCSSPTCPSGPQRSPAPGSVTSLAWGRPEALGCPSVASWGAFPSPQGQGLDPASLISPTAASSLSARGGSSKRSTRLQEETPREKV